jgi:hypothetical protein
MKKAITILLFSILIACESAEIKKTTENFNRFEGTWKISKIDLSKVPEAFKVSEINGNLTFSVCKANKNALKDNNGSQGCMGNAKINNTDFITNVEHQQNTPEEIRLKFFKLDNNLSNEELKQVNILSGMWQVLDKTDKTFKLSKKSSLSTNTPNFEVVIEGQLQ